MFFKLHQVNYNWLGNLTNNDTEKCKNYMNCMCKKCFSKLNFNAKKFKCDA